jgi:hypothetical protein
MANTYLQRIIEAGSTGRKWTYSAWLKHSGVRNGSGAHNCMWNCSSDDDSAHYIDIHIKNTDKLDIQFRKGTSGDNGTYIRRITSRVFRDPNAWLHVVIRLDTTQGSADDRLRVYVNGVQETSFSTSSGTIPQNYQTEISTTGSENRIGRGAGSSSSYWDGSMSHLHLCDDYSYGPTEFGETDATTGEWKIKTNPSVSYGTNGFFIFKDDNAVTDRSGQGHNLSLEAGTLTKTEDCPSNVFATMNPLDANASMLFANGNTTTVSPSNNYMPCKATIGMLGQNGKFYWEGKCLSGSAHYFGVYDVSGTVRGSVQSEMDSNRFVYTYQGGIERTITGQSAIGSGTYATFANNDIIGVGLDKENGTITFWKNGTQIYTETHSSLQTKDLIAGTQAYGSDINWNFGNGTFGTTAVSSAGTNASGIGIFEYDTPSGYTALSTKGLNL